MVDLVKDAQQEKDYTIGEDPNILDCQLNDEMRYGYTLDLAKLVSIYGTNTFRGSRVGDVESSITTLILNGADVAYVYPDGLSLVGRAARNGEERICLILLRMGATWGAGCSDRDLMAMKLALEYTPAALMRAYRYGEGVVISSELHHRFMEETGIYANHYNGMTEAINNYIQDKRGMKVDIADIEQEDSDFYLFDREQLRAALDTENGRGRDYLKALHRSGHKRKFTVITRSGIDAKLDVLREKFPNFGEAIDYMRRYIMLSALSKDGRLQISPLLLAGPPGVGKTKFLHAFSKMMDSEFNLIGCSSISAGWVIGGSSATWSDGKMGMVVGALRDGETANPIIMLDEIDKLSGDSRQDGFGPLYSLMEHETAKRFIDESVGIPVNCSKINWVCTANETRLIPEPILSRLSVINIPAPNADQLRSILRSVYQDILSDHKDTFGMRFEPEINEELVDELSDLSPREMRAKIIEAMGNAAGSREESIYKLVIEDFNIAQRQKVKQVGFIQNQ